jgi:hypothetical protein
MSRLNLLVLPFLEHPSHNASRDSDEAIPRLFFPVGIAQQVIQGIVDRSGYLSVSNIINGRPSCCNVAKLLAGYTEENAKLTVWNKGTIGDGFETPTDNRFLAIC